MSKPSRRRRAASNGTGPGPIEQAIDAAAAKAAPVELAVLLDRKPMRLAPTARLTVKAMENPNEAPLLVRGPDGIWHGVILPPGSTFELRATGPAAALWTPPQ